MIDLAADSQVFGHDDGEEVVYHPQGRSSRTISGAVVDREGFERFAGGDGAGPRHLVHVPNSTTLGISRGELNVGQDMLELAVEIGGQTSRRQIMTVVSEDRGMLTLSTD